MRLAERLGVIAIAGVYVENIDPRDYPDFCDAYIAEAEVEDENGWRSATDDELDIMNDDSDFVYDNLFDQLF